MMRRAQLRKLLLVVAVTALLVVPTESFAQGSGTDVRVGLGLTFSNGFRDLADRFLDVYGVDTTVVFPVGVSLNTTVQIPHGSIVASVPTAGVGPVSLVSTKEFFLGSFSYYWRYVDVPINGSYGIKFFPGRAVGPYARVGIAYHFTFGELAESSAPGLFVSGGADLFQTRRVNLQLEVAYDDSTVTFGGFSDFFRSTPAQEIKTGGLLISVRAVF
jgi:hypothetical protein